LTKHIKWIDTQAGNFYRRGSLSTIDLLIEIAFCKKRKNQVIKKSQKLLNARRPIVQIFPFHEGFPGSCFGYLKNLLIIFGTVGTGNPTREHWLKGKVKYS
jgi:hypothetical protein